MWTKSYNKKGILTDNEIKKKQRGKKLLKKKRSMVDIIPTVLQSNILRPNLKGNWSWFTIQQGNNDNSSSKRNGFTVRESRGCNPEHLSFHRINSYRHRQQWTIENINQNITEHNWRRSTDEGEYSNHRNSTLCPVERSETEWAI